MSCNEIKIYQSKKIINSSICGFYVLNDLILKIQRKLSGFILDGSVMFINFQNSNIKGAEKVASMLMIKNVDNLRAQIFYNKQTANFKFLKIIKYCIK